jgi:hypothetical protein
MSRSWKSVRPGLVRAIQDRLGLETDLVVSEVETAESRVEAIRRLEAISRDVEIALDFVVRGVPSGVKEERA